MKTPGQRHGARVTVSLAGTWVTYHCGCGKVFSSENAPYGGEASEKWHLHAMRMIREAPMP
jgi:hypothetical protein